MVQAQTVSAGVAARGHGFSLIELLVVISIIAVLIGLLLPALPRVLDSARRTGCAANMRSIGQVLELYKDANRRVYPEARYMPYPWLTAADSVPSLPEALDTAGFMERELEAWRCPGDRRVYRFDYIDENGDPQQGGSSYSFVTALSGISFENSFFARFLRLQASETPVLLDFDGGTFETEPQFGGDVVTVDFFHRGRNILYADASVGQGEALASQQENESDSGVLPGS